VDWQPSPWFFQTPKTNTSDFPGQRRGARHSGVLVQYRLQAQKIQRSSHFDRCTRRHHMLSLGTHASRPGIHGVHVHQQFSVLWAVAGTSCLKRLFSMLKAGCHGFTCNWQDGCAILAVFVNVYDHPQSTRQLEREGRLSCRCKFQCRTPTGLALQEPC